MWDEREGGKGRIVVNEKEGDCGRGKGGVERGGMFVGKGVG